MTTQDIAPAAPAPDLDDGLTEEERAAFLLDDEDDGAAGADQENDDAGDEADEDTGGDAAGADDAAGVDDAANAGRDDGGAAEADADDEPSAAPVPTAPVFVANAPADLDAKLADIAAKKDTLISQFDDGDITAKEYQVQLDAIGKEERALERAVDKAEMSAQMESQRRQNEWDAQCADFFKQNKAYANNERLFRAVNQEVIDIAKSETGSKLSGPEILALAHANLVEAGMVKDAAPAPAEKGKPKVIKPNLPPNLARVPAAETDDTDGGKYASLDRLQSSDPIAYEERLMKLSDADRRAYLAA